MKKGELRKKFERWLRRSENRDVDFDINEFDGGYEDGDVDRAWRAYKAGARGARRVPVTNRGEQS